MKYRIICLICILCLLAGCHAEPKPVLKCGEYTMDSDQFQYYFSYQYANVLEVYGSEAFNPKEDLSAQQYDDDQSWQEFLVQQGMTLAEQTVRMCLAAQEDGYSLGEQRNDLEAVAAETAKEAGYPSVEDYLNAYYGEGATIEGYREFLESMALADSYSEYLNTSVEYSDAEVEAFYDSRAIDYSETFQIPKNYDARLDVRIIRFYPDDPGSAEDWLDAERRAQTLLEEFRNDPSDEAFAELADTHTEDYHSPEGGLYEGICPDQMGETLNAWLFPKDTVRCPGDCDWMDNEDHVVLCYIHAVDDRPYWRVVAENDLRYADYIEKLYEIDGKYVFEQYPENVNLRVPTAHTASTAQKDGIEAVG